MKESIEKQKSVSTNSRHESFAERYYGEIISNPEFKGWFEESKVVDGNGVPLVVFHSTSKKEFNGNFKLNTESNDWLSWGIYFSSDRKATRDYFSQDYDDALWRYNKADNYPEHERRELLAEKESFLSNHEPVIKTFGCFLKINNPLYLDNHQQLMDLHYSGVTREVIQKKYDGIIIRHDPNFTDQFIVFNPDQIYTLPSDVELHKFNS